MYTKYLTTLVVFIAFSGDALAKIAPTPAPLVGAVSGSFGLIVAVACYAGYKVYKAKSR